VAVGKSVTLPVVITNSRGWDVTVTAMQSTNGEFSLSGASLPLTLSHGQSTTVNVTFTPQAAGPVGSSLYIYPALVVPMTGTGSAVGQLVLAPAPLNFGSVTVGKTGTQSLTLSATGGSVTVSSAASGNPQFVLEGASFPFTIAAGQSQSFNVAFTPASSGAQSSSLIFASNASNSQASESLSGTGAAATVLGQLVLSPTPLSFGSVTVGQTSTQPLTLSAMGGNVTVTSASSGSSEFVLGGASFPFTIAAGQSQSFSVAFTPTNSGAQSSSLIFASNASNSQAAESVSGTGTLAVGQLVLAPTPLSFGNVTVGQTGTQSLTLSATGGSVTVSSAASGNAQFVLEGASFPFTIASGQSQSFNVAFTPTASGAQSSSLSFTSNASNSQASESLSGTGMAASYSVNLYWNASSDATGYNVYRSASASGSYAKINSSLTPSTSFTDSSVTSGQTYYYAATSVNSEGAESARSAAVQAVIP
jgi:hypothetical protein